MKNKLTSGVLCFATVVTLGGCAGQPQTYSMDQYGSESPQQVTFPNGTMFGGASNRQASSLAQMVADSNNNNMKEYEDLQQMASKNQQTTQQALQMLRQQQATGAKNLQTSQQALGMLEALSQKMCSRSYPGSSRSKISLMAW